MYYFAFKGQRQLNWSRGLRKLASKNQVEKTDQEIVDETDNVAELMFKLDIELWHVIRKTANKASYLFVLQKDHTLKKAIDFIKQCLIDHKLIEDIP